MTSQVDIATVLKKHASEFHPVIIFNSETASIAPLNLSKSNTGFTKNIYTNCEKFIKYIDKQRKTTGAEFLIGGYQELREMYRRSKLFDKNLATEVEINREPRSFHLGTDIWGKAGTSIFAPLEGKVHSFAFNYQDGDYGATIILKHQLEKVNFYTLYGHLSLIDIVNLKKGQFISKGEVFAHFGFPLENGNWPPHLHFQIILNMSKYKGDYPGVCKLSEAKKYLKISPDPDLILQLNRYIQ